MSEIDKYQQGELNLEVVTSKEVDGIEMGVLSDGTPFLTARGLARVCGIHHSNIVRMPAYSALATGALREKKISELLDKQGFGGGDLFLKVQHEGRAVNAYSDAVCMAILEYYAFEAGRNKTEDAENNYRALARQSLRAYIYTKTGYDPMRQALQSWQHFHDRLLLNTVPSKYFGVFTETAQLVLTSIREGLLIDSHTVPDISVGMAWGKFWNAQKLADKYGARTKHPHMYPDYFPQAQANGDIEAYIYPLEALGEFRGWLENTYLPQKFPNYLKRKEKQGILPASRVQSLLKAVQPQALPPAV